MYTFGYFNIEIYLLIEYRKILIFGYLDIQISIKVFKYSIF